MSKVIKKAFTHTIPVMAGYLSMGIAFGILLQSIGYGPQWALLMSVTMFAGTGQFMAVEFLAAGANLGHVALLTFLVNFRHIFYGLSMISRYKGVGIRKLYLIFGLTDETYAILTGYRPERDIKEKDYYLAVTLMDQLYWIIGCVVGAAAGQIIPFDTTGIEFAMTALFAVLVVEQWKSNRNHIPALLGFGVTIVALLVFGPDSFLIPTLIVLSFILLCLQNRFEKEGENE